MGVVRVMLAVGMAVIVGWVMEKMFGRRCGGGSWGCDG